MARRTCSPHRRNFIFQPSLSIRVISFLWIFPRFSNDSIDSILKIDKIGRIWNPGEAYTMLEFDSLFLSWEKGLQRTRRLKKIYETHAGFQRAKSNNNLQLLKASQYDTILRFKGKGVNFVWGTLHRRNNKYHFSHHWVI